MFSAKIGTLARVYIRDREFPEKKPFLTKNGGIVLIPGKKAGDRLFFEGTLKEIVQKKNLSGDLRFRDGYVTLRGNFSTRIGGFFRKSPHKKIAIGDITRILAVGTTE